MKFKIEPVKGFPDMIMIFNGSDLVCTTGPTYAQMLAAAPEMLQILKNIVASAPLTGLPPALEKDIQDACIIIQRGKV